LQIAGDALVGTVADVVLTNGAKAENIFWQVAGAVEVGFDAHLEGVFLVKTKMVFMNGSSLNGRALAQTAVTMDNTTITQPTGTRRYLRSV
jgi:hypothetical protein